MSSLDDLFDDVFRSKNKKQAKEQFMVTLRKLIDQRIRAEMAILNKKFGEGREGSFVK